MLNLDQYESVFRSAAKQAYQYQPMHIDHVLLCTDMLPEQLTIFRESVAAFLKPLGDSLRWTLIGNDAFSDAETLLNICTEKQPDLICTYRNLRSKNRKFPFSLGSYVDVLTQATKVPVMLLPAPNEDGSLGERCTELAQVLVMTEHLTGSNTLVNYGALFTKQGGELFLVHLEDDHVFARYAESISKIPEVDTDIAVATIRAQLLKEPADFIKSCADVLRSEGVNLTVHEVVKMGHHVSDCRQLIDHYGVDLLVMNTKDEGQAAMHGLAYPIAVEIRDTAMLLL
jgi:nucleotide-binding universal stress UspA family protein